MQGMGFFTSKSLLSDRVTTGDVMETKRRVRDIVAAAILAAASLNGAPAPAAEYHVSTRGADDHPGAAAAPFRTIQRAAGAMRAGDTCVVHAGTYRETVRPAASGEAGRPIRFVAAEGETVTVSGTDLVANWAVYKDKIYKAAVTGPVDSVFVNGRLMTRARTPNAGDDPYKPNLLTAALDQETCVVEGATWPADYWKGGAIWGVGKTGWVFGSAAVAGSEGNRIRLAGKIPFWRAGPGKIALIGALAALDAEREWHDQEGALYLWAPGGQDPNRLEVEVARRRWAFDLSGRAHVEIAGFRLMAASITMDQAIHCVIDRCRARHVSLGADIRGGFNRDRGIGPQGEGLGIVVGGSRNTVRNSVIAWCAGDGISVYGAENTVENCVVHDCDLSASDCAPITCTGAGHAILGNTLFNAGRSVLVHRYFKKGRIERNHIYNAGLMTQDLGATYTFQTDGEGAVIAYNWVHDVHCHTGVGIYIDNGSPNHVIHHNLSYNNSDCGLRLNTPTRNVLIYNNTLTRNGKSIAWWGKGTSDQTGVMLVNNILTDKVSLGKGAAARHNFTEPDPMFADPEKGDFRLKPASPCVDAGEAVAGITDGHAGKAPDLGCFEHGKEPWAPGSTIPRAEWEEKDGG